MQNSELVKIAETFGSPIYVYDSERITHQYNR
jgi:diaminopimelate decarboxylase